LRSTGLVTASRTRRSITYSARFQQMNALITFLTKTCCNGIGCVPAGSPPVGPSALALP